MCVSFSDLDMFASTPLYAIEGKEYIPKKMEGREDYECPEFVQHLNSLFWFSYRSGFPDIQPSSRTTDAGWGCMLRSTFI